jgi:hypothetical protein
MAGIFQHHIPQSLLRGFRISGGSKKKSKVWFYENGCVPRLELVKDIGGEPFFYSELPTDGAKTLDDKITDYETLFDRHFRQLKATPAGQAVDSRQASEVVAHLTIRNAHLRQIFSLGLESIYSGSASLFGNEANLRPILGVDDKIPSERLREAVDQQIAQNPELASSRVPARVLYQIVQMALQENFNQLFSDQIPQFITMLSQIASDAPRLAREAHNNALETVATPDGRIQLLEVLGWSVQTASDISFILPDCVALGLDKKDGFQSLMGAGLKDVEAVLMPLSPTKILVGLRPGAPLPSLQDFNGAAAASSNSFFVAELECDQFKEFQKSIATSTSHFMEETMGAVFTQFAKERGLPLETGMNATEEAAIDSTEVDLPEALTPTAPNYTVNFLGCADQETAERIAATLNSVTRELVRLMPLDRLDGVTFAHDYPAALRDLNRGFAANAPLQPTNEDYGVGIAMAPLVVREGVPKTHIVMRGDIGHCLIDDDEAQWRFALHTVVQQLAHVSCMQILDETLPGVLLSRLPDPYAAFLYPCTEAAWEGYFTCRASATFKSDAGDSYVELLVSVLRRAQADIRAAKLRYHLDKDMDRLMSVVLPRINDILRFAGNVLGHGDGLSQSFTQNQHLADELEKAGLLNWFTLFDSELSELWSRSGGWTSIDEFLHLNRHVERLFWQFRLIPWKTDDEKIWVEVMMDVETQSGVASKAAL